MISILGYLGWVGIRLTYICYIVWVSVDNGQVIDVYGLET